MVSPRHFRHEHRRLIPVPSVLISMHAVAEQVHGDKKDEEYEKKISFL
jgi:hypothetical protein